MTKLLTGIPKKGRKAVYSRMTGWSRLLLLPKFRQGVDPRFQMEHMDRNSKWPKLFYGSICFKGGELRGDNISETTIPFGLTQ
jgi:hypothetical protein